MDTFGDFKNAQRESWKHFIPFEMITGAAAPQLVNFAKVKSGQRVLDVGCGTGVVALTAARLGATVSGLDLSPALLARGNESATIAGVQVEFKEGDVESLPFADGTFDVVLSQFGHMFAPRPEVAVKEMLRVLKPGGTIAFSTWPPELFTGRMFKLTSSYMPPPPPGIAPPSQWGDPTIVRQRLSEGVKDLTFSSGTIYAPALSPQHLRTFIECNAGPVINLMKTLEKAPNRLAEFRREFDRLIEQYFSDNAVRQDFLMTRAVKSS